MKVRRVAPAIVQVFALSRGPASARLGCVEDCVSCYLECVIAHSI